MNKQFQLKIIRDLLLRDCAKGREKETQLHHSHNFMKTHIVKQTKHK